MKTLVIITLIFVFVKEVLVKRSGGSRGSDSGSSSYQSYGSSGNSKSSGSSWPDSSYSGGYNHHHHHSSWSAWSGNDHWSSWSNEDDRFALPNTKYILEGLAIYGAVGPITRNRSSSSYSGITYYHGSRFYTKSEENKLTCYYTPQYIYFAVYDDGQRVSEIVYECNTKSQYCCEMECCSTTAWWVVAIFAFVIVGIMVCMGIFVLCCSEHE